MVDLQELCDDARGEHDEVRSLLAERGDADFARPTPAEGWTVRDQVAHLAFFDAAARLAVTDPDRFRAEELPGAQADPAGYMEGSLAFGGELRPAALLDRWAEERADLVAAVRAAPGGARTPWYGPDMSVASAVTARIMETWAHGQDVADALGVVRAPTGRLRHVCDLGVRTRAYSFAARGRSAPEEPVRVELTAPDGSTWAWGPEADAASGGVVAGPAVDFALVVTQRRHLDDTALAVHGDGAREWMAIAQAFAGPPGRGRRPVG